MGRKSYTRVLLKLSGESLAGDLGYGIDPQTLTAIASEIKEVVESGVQRDREDHLGRPPSKRFIK